MTINDFLNMDVIALSNYIDDKKHYDKISKDLYRSTCECIDAIDALSNENFPVNTAGNRQMNVIVIEILKDYTERIKRGEIK